MPAPLACFLRRPFLGTKGGGGPTSGDLPTDGAGPQAALADSLVESVGAAGHFERSNAYGDPNYVKLAFAYLGLRYARSRAYVGNSQYVSTVSDLWTSLGVRTMMSLGIPSQPKPGQWPAANLADVLASAIPHDAILGFEAGNEQNLLGQRNDITGNTNPRTGVAYKDSEWPQAVWDHCAEAFTAITTSSDPDFKKKPYYGPSVGNPSTSNCNAMGTGAPTSAGFDPITHKPNLHEYGFDNPNTTDLTGAIASTRGTAPKSTSPGIFPSVTRPITITESGVHNFMPEGATASGHKGSLYDLAAKNIPKWIVDSVTRSDIERVFLYQLLDENKGTWFKSGDSALAHEDNQDHFGLLFWKAPSVTVDATSIATYVKPHGLALRNLLALHNDPAGALDNPGQLNYTLTAPGSSLASLNVKQNLFQGHDGTFLLSIWRDVSLWNPSTTGPDYGALVSVTAGTVLFKHPAATLKLRWPSRVPGVGTYTAADLIGASYTAAQVAAGVSISLADEMVTLLVTKT